MAERNGQDVPDDIPLVADYDGDGIADLATRRNSTGMQYILSIRDNAIAASALATMRNKEGVPILSCDPALLNTVSAVSSICYTDGKWGILEYRGIPISQLVEKADMTEVSFLLVYGRLPS